MPWCPVCKNEYVEGITECADCKVALVDSLEEIERIVIAEGNEEQMRTLGKFLEYNQIETASVEVEEENGKYFVKVVEEEFKKAKSAAYVFLQQEAVKEKLEAKEAGEEEEEIQSLRAPSPIYENRSEKAENFKSSAYTLTIVGVLGCIFLLLSCLKVLPFQFSMLTYVGMGILFAAFAAIGIHSFVSYKKIAEEAVVENSLLEDVKQWCGENITRDGLEEALFEEDSVPEELSEEMKYFKRAEKMKSLIAGQFADLEDGLLDAVVEEQYNHIYGE